MQKKKEGLKSEQYLICKIQTHLQKKKSGLSLQSLLAHSAVSPPQKKENKKNDKRMQRHKSPIHSKLAIFKK